MASTYAAMCVCVFVACFVNNKLLTNNVCSSAALGTLLIDITITSITDTHVISISSNLHSLFFTCHLTPRTFANLTVLAVTGGGERFILYFTFLTIYHNLCATF